MRNIVKSGVGLLLALAAVAAMPAQLPQRAVLGGKAVVMLADLVYAFEAARPRVASIAGTDQGMGEFLAGLDPAFRNKPTLDRQANAEAYAALKPDLVVLKSAMKPSLGAQLAALGIRQLYLDLETPEDYQRDIAAVGAAFGQETRAAELAAWYRAKADLVAGRVAADPAPRPRVLLVQLGPGGMGFQVPPRGWMQTSLVTLTGGEPVWREANPGGGWGKIDFEQIAAWNPDVLLAVDYVDGVDALAARLRADPRFAGLACAKGGRIYGFPQDFYSWDQPDTRWILGLQWLARTLHPASFPVGSALGDAREFFRVLYGLDDAGFDRLVKPRLKGDLGPR
jgi:iron complex transport system substrate-binding protein